MSEAIGYRSMAENKKPLGKGYIVSLFCGLDIISLDLQGFTYFL